MSTTQLEINISEAIKPVVEESGHDLVCVEMGQEGNMPILRVMCEDPKTKRINIDACAKISREVSVILDVEDLISHQYRLEVSSPGIDRPLTSTNDFANYIGHEARVWLKMPMENGQKKFRGTIKGTTESEIILTIEDNEQNISFDHVERAKLVLTDKLIKETSKSFEVSSK